MSGLNELEKACAGIIASKVNERKKSVENLANLLEKEEIVNAINKNEDIQYWNKIIRAMHSYLQMEAEKRHQDEIKKLKTVSYVHTDLLLLGIETANKGCIRLDGQQLLKYVIECLESQLLKKYFVDKYLTILSDCILGEPRYYGRFEMHEWINLLELLKNLNNFEDMKILYSIRIIIKSGPLHKLPLFYLRNEFDLVSKLCQGLKESQSKRQKIEILELLINFCEQNSGDCCLACCKLGEDVFKHLRALYKPSTTDTAVKKLLFEFFFLQIKLHHPKGAIETDRISYAFSWPEWKKQLATMYFIVQEEMKYQLRRGSKTIFCSSKIKDFDTLQTTFVALCVGIFRQVFNSRFVNFANSIIQNEIDDEPQSKRQCVEITFNQILVVIEETKAWQWIYIISEYLNLYPDSIEIKHFQHLLQIISNIVTESINSEVINHCFNCLDILMNVEQYILDDNTSDRGEFDRIWMLIQECVSRCAGLNQNVETTHKILQKLITKMKIEDVDSIFHMFFSGIMLVTPFSLQTFKITASLHNLPEISNGTSYRKTVIRWLLNTIADKIEVPDVYVDEITAEILVKLCLKQWPIDVQSFESKEEESFEDIYELNAFKKMISMEKNIKNNYPQKICFINKDIFDYFLDYIENIASRIVIIKSNCNYIKDLSKIVCLFGNVLSILEKYQLIGNWEDIFDKFRIKDCFMIINDSIVQSFDISNLDIKTFKELIIGIKMILSLNLEPTTGKMIRNFVSTDMLKCFFDIINCEDNDSRKTDFGSLQILCMEILCNFCLYTKCVSLNDIQSYALITLSESTYACEDPFQYQLISTFLSRFKDCPPGVLDDNVLENILNMLQNTCQARFTEYSVVLEILNTLNDIVDHIIASGNTDLKKNYMNLLQQFYDIKDNYGYKVTLLIIKCILQLIKDDFNSDWTTCENTELIAYIPNFLTSNYQEIRLAAIKCLITIFELNSLTDDSIFLTQKKLFITINYKSQEVFKIETNSVSKERTVDEVVGRTSSVLHTYASLMVHSSLWRKKLLYFLIHLVHDKKIDTDSLDRILDLVAVNLQLKNNNIFLSSYAEYILCEWYNEKNSIKEFPCNILGFSSNLELYKDYGNILIPLLFYDDDKPTIEMVSVFLNKSITEIYEICFPEVLVKYFLHQSNSAKILYNDIVEEISQDKVQELLLENVDKIITIALKFIVDEDEFQKQFNMPYKLLQEREELTVTYLYELLSLLQEKLNIKKQLLEYCILNYPNKIQKILMSLYLNAQQQYSMEDKIKSLHQYAIFIDYILKSLTVNNPINEFFVRNTIYGLLYLIKKSNTDIFTVIVIRFLKHFCSRILNLAYVLLSNYLAIIVNTLVSLISKKNGPSTESIDLLRYLVVNNSETLHNYIGNLDPFPLEQNLEEINEVYIRIRCATVTNSLENEIKHFLGVGEFDFNVDLRTHALQHLKLLLSTKKSEFKVLHEKCKDTKEYAKNTEDNSLHKLICMLIQLSASSNNNVSMEATRCLGELGPLDFQTLVLQPQAEHQFSTLSPLQLLTSEIISLLAVYIIDESIELIDVATKALYGVLATKEGRLFIENADDNEKKYKKYLYPFVSKRANKNQSVVELVENKFKKNLEDDAIWWPSSDHDSWIKSLTCKLLECFSDKCFLHKLIPVCKIKVPFCEKLLPHVIHLIVSFKEAKYAKAIIMQLNVFFNNIWHMTIEGVTNNNKKVSTQSMLNIIHFLRLNYKNTYNLDLHYLKISQAAYYCSNYFAALLFIELWSKANFNDNDIGNASVLEHICENENNDISNAVQTILKQSYTALGELDALYGCNFSNIINVENRVEYFKQIDKWDQVLLHYETQISSGILDRSSELVNSLKNCGLYHLATNYDNSERDYECLWRLSRFENDNSKGTPVDIYEKYKYEALKCLQEHESELFNVAIEKARHTVVDTMKNFSIENIMVLYNCLTKLQSIQELEDAHNAKQSTSFHNVLCKWNEQDALDKIDFKSVEPIKAQRISILNGLVKNGISDLKEDLLKSYLDLAVTARKYSHFNVAMRTINNMGLISEESHKYNCLKIFEEAQICWLMNNKNTAKYLIKHLLKINDNDDRLKFASLKLYGMWMAETHSENSQTILYEYFLKSLKVIESIELTQSDYEDIFSAYDVIARFSDSEYQRILLYMKSAEFERKLQTIEKSKKTADKIKTQSKRLDYDQRKAVIIHHKQSVIDQTEIDNTRREKDQYFMVAIKYYLLSLQYSDVSNIRAFRILSLWLENRTTKGLEKILQSCLPKIPTYKFVPILPQITPHLTNVDDDFGNRILNVIERCAKDHPHHTLPIILALVNSNKDNVYSKAMTKMNSNEARVLGAQMLLKKLKQDPNLRSIIGEMELVAEALIQFAYTDLESCTVERKRKSDDEVAYTIPSNLKIQKIKNYTNVLLPTLTVPIRKDCKYDDITGIHSYNKDFGTVGGINCPKKIYCRGTDGITYTQLLKGKDDLRQDAVMEQVFMNINELLHTNKSTRHLLIRTYKVVPLSRRSGILEWVKSIRIGDYLTKAHKQYNSNDWTPDKCRNEMKKVANGSSDEKLDKFKEICKNFRPIFHKFFEIKFLEPLTWFQRRKVYMHSIATTSMCGYILGLGDRHLQNILMDEFTAEVIHIDFGIAFEQGRVLPTPETVPFRLTRDIEDAMGITRIEGVFRKSCEKTMEVMRQNSETIITILEVLLYDPLYEWTISPAEAYSRQCSNETDATSGNSLSNSDEDKIYVNVTAERALLRLKQKLHGTEEGGPSSVEGQVEKLLQQARDPSNLSRLFVGWQPYL